MVISFDRTKLDGACSIGLEDADKYLTIPGKKIYTVQEAIDAGMPPLWTAWLLATRAQDDEESLELLIEGTQRVAGEAGLKIGDLKTTEQCQDVLYDSIVVCFREIVARDGHSRDARTHTFARLGPIFVGALFDRGLIQRVSKREDEEALRS